MARSPVTVSLLRLSAEDSTSTKEGVACCTQPKHCLFTYYCSRRPHCSAARCYLRQTDLLHSFLILRSIGSPYFLFASFLSRGCIRVRFLRLNFLTFQKNEYSASYDPLSYYEAGRYCTSQMPAVYVIPLQSLSSSSTASTRSSRYVQTARLQHTASTGY